MGTRNLTCVVLGGEYRVAQYGQWDGYPTGQGETIVDFLIGANLDRFRKQIAKTRAIDAAAAQAKLKSDDKTCPFSRDMGAGILAHIQKAAKPEVFMQMDFAADSLFCEWAYVVDLDKNTLEVFKGFNKAPLDKAERFYCLEHKSDRGYHPVRLLASVPFADLTPTTMADLEARDAEADE